MNIRERFGSAVAAITESRLHDTEKTVTFSLGISTISSLLPDRRFKLQPAAERFDVRTFAS